MQEGHHMKVYLEEGAVLPQRAHDTDAGLDLFSRQQQVIKAHGSAVFKTGVHVQLPQGCCGLIVSKSGLNIKHDITSSGLIDEGYEGEICVKLYNHSDSDYTVMAGDKITQMVVIPIRYEPVEEVSHLEAVSDRGSDGFGSTGR